MTYQRVNLDSARGLFQEILDALRTGSTANIGPFQLKVAQMDIRSAETLVIATDEPTNSLVRLTIPHDVNETAYAVIIP